MTPEEAWTGEKPLVDYFRVFGCAKHVHILYAKRSKLEYKSVTCVLLGVSSESKGYKMFDPTTNKIIVSCNIAFEADREWHWKFFEGERKLDWWIENTAEEGKVTVEMTKLVAETIEPVAENKEGEITEEKLSKAQNGDWLWTKKSNPLKKIKHGTWWFCQLEQRK